MIAKSSRYGALSIYQEIPEITVGIKMENTFFRGFQRKIPGNIEKIVLYFPLFSQSSAFYKIERLTFTFTPNGRREFVPRDQVFPYFSVHSLLLLHKNN